MNIKIELPNHVKGRSITTKVIPTMATLKNMLVHLEKLDWQEEKLQQWNKRSFKAYHIEQIKRELMHANEEERKETIRQHILRLKPHEIGASLVDIYIVGYVNHKYGEGKEVLANWLRENKVTENRNSMGAIWEVGKGDGVYLDILETDGSIKDWNFMIKWIGLV